MSENTTYRAIDGWEPIHTAPKDGRRVRVHPAEQYRVAWAPQIEERLERWIVREE